ncbi:phage holin family protein [Tetragenococcus koreensis]|uniref:Holin n=1 Tax=Tetragenococcus koreensis TaxID=290335 RepID=A0AAN4RLM3_9ENTE|nr:phage holin family protein [Tetragenococcus koreensis]MDN6641063.1 phage holin family protein [Tetragenococcus sp.]AYW44606.1 holin [Tetragenococcus koreensis]MCF1616181.1 phage holin family protein [Tetragenococcus koreensis]MCF1621021.1 phage holin family protein [Tetragenococcus koreensis]MCF1626047.1 phage holin family protein [Tetragenococcus koreensis]
MGLEILNDRLVPIIVIACLIVGYVIKTTPVLQVAREYIPFIVCVLGAILGGTVIGVSVEAIVIGAASGLASTGLHQAFAKVLNLKKGE